MTQIFRTEMPLFKKGLTMAQRITYSASAAHFLFGLPRLIFLVAPSFFMVFGCFPLRAKVIDVLAYAIPHLFLATVCTSAMHGNRRHSFWPEVYETALAPYTALVTTSTLLFPGQAAFNVTPKGERTDRRYYDWRKAWPVLALLGLCLVTMGFTPFRMLLLPEDRGTTLLVAAWNLYNVLLLGAAAFVALERPQRRSEWRINFTCKVWFRDQDFEEPTDVGDGRDRKESWRSAEALDLSEGGVRLRVWDDGPIPERLDLLMEVESGEVVALTGEPVNEFQTDGDELLVGVRFNELTRYQRDQLIRLMFSRPDSWLKDRYRTDSPLRSALSVLRSLFGMVVSRRGDDQQHGMGDPLTPIVTARRCTRCGTLDLAGASHCASCRGNLDDAEDPMEMMDTFHRPHLPWVAIFSGLAMVGFSAGLAWGWTPDVDRLAVPIDAPSSLRGADRERYQELVRVHQELRQSYWTFRASLLPAGPALPPSWGEKLFWLQREYRLHPGGARSNQLWQAEGALRGALLTLMAADREYRSGASPERIDEMLDSIRRLLSEAAIHMKKGRT